MSEASIRAELTATYRRVAALGLNELASGNISARMTGGMLISPAGATADAIDDRAFVQVDDDGRWADDAGTPSSEWRMHLEIYRRTGAGAVVHTHADHCVALAAHRRALPGFTYVVGFFGGRDVPCVPYHTFGSVELADAAADALVERTGCLLANHGAITRGRSLGEAADAAHRLELLCRQYLTALVLGEPTTLTPAEWTDFEARARAHGYGDAV